MLTREIFDAPRKNFLYLLKRTPYACLKKAIFPKRNILFTRKTKEFFIPSME